MAKFCDRNLNTISEKKWRELHEDYEYTHLAEYENENLLVQAVWHGRVDSRAHEMFWEPFALLIWRRYNGGKWVEMPETVNFSDADDALFAYRKILISNPTGCFMNGNELVELGNLAAERRQKAIMEQREKQQEKERAAQEAAARKVAIAKAKEEERVRKEMEAAEAARLEAERIEREKMEARGPMFGSW